MSNQSVLFGGSKPPALWVTGAAYGVPDVVLSATDYRYYVRIIAGVGSTDPSADATNWRLAGASGIKSIQRGAISSGGGIATATITAVNVNKTELRFLGVTAMQYPQYLQLTNSTTVSAICGSGGGTSGTVGWELTEWF
jgi:hypothetical protein